ncbi:hypothetical protein AB0K60_07140 [Thermopolyspora sp. NPDC052614]|uniref:hypothetical protein n=1 Tax=Thermopolyspora sp. NPDC052614 TaxID=3155682 RepID=UPI0034279D9E
MSSKYRTVKATQVRPGDKFANGDEVTDTFRDPIDGGVYIRTHDGDFGGVEPDTRFRIHI